MGAARVAPTSPERLTAAATALAAAVDVARGELPSPERERAKVVVDKVGERTALVGGHTVVALAGATGSGKSSLFNALVGADVAVVGVRRPTTAEPVAAIWGEEPAGHLLDWLGVSARHRVEETGGQVGSLDGLVLLDLPDVDSLEVANREEAARVLDLVDLFVWVTDPQKYADARLHDDHVRALATHESVTIVVLNQVDRLSAPDIVRCRDDLARLMARDGVPQVAVHATSATHGRGVDELRQRIANVVASRSATRARLAADVRAAAGALRSHIGDSEPRVGADARSDLLDALSRSAGVPLVLDAVDRDYRMQAALHTGWPVTRWIQRLRARPLRRLRLDGRDVRVTQSDVRSVLGRSSLPPPTPAARAEVSMATRRVAERASQGLPVPWADAVDRAAAPSDEGLADALDQAVVSTPLGTPPRHWWGAISAIQGVLAGAATAGLLWLAASIVLGWLRLDTFVGSPPTWRSVPVPVILAAGGLLLGPALAACARWFARIGGRRRARAVDEQLRGAIAVVAEDEVVGPVERVLARHAAARAALGTAASV
jgi:GTP-binding protein EngB required for normal cell division